MIHLDKKIIFVHIPKCAGGSLRNIFKKNKFFKPMKNRLPKQRIYGCGAFFEKADNSVPKHGSVTDYIEKVKELGFNHKDFFKICVIRNPWDRVVSHYYHVSSADVRNWLHLRSQEGLSEEEKMKRRDYKRIMLQASDQFTFEKYLENKNYLLNIKAYSKMFYEKKYVIDFVVRYENYEKDVFDLMKKLGVENYYLNKINYGTSRPLKDDYRSYYNDETKKIIYQEFEEEIDMFGYTF